MASEAGMFRSTVNVIHGYAEEHVGYISAAGFLVC